MEAIQNPFEVIIRQNSEILERVRKLEATAGKTEKPELPKFFNVEDIERITGWSKATIYSKTHRRQLPVVKAGKKLLFPSREFIEHMERLGRPVIEST